MQYLWEGDLAKQVSQRQDFWRKKELIDGDLMGEHAEVNPAYKAYFAQLQQEAEMLIGEQTPRAVGGSLHLMDIDARLSFLINELALDPEKDLATFKEDEAKYYLTDYVKLEFTNKNTLLNQLINQEGKQDLVMEK